MEPSVAIVILNYNGKHYLKQFLPFVLATTYSNKSIWIIDNASTDDSIAFVKEYFPEIQIVALSKNYGFAEGYNLGLSQIVSDYYILLNSDVEVTPGFIEPVISLMEKDCKIAFAQSKLLDLYQRNTFEYAGAAGGLIDAVGYPFCRGRVLETVETDNGQYDDTTEIFWASGCCLFARASVYKMLGGMYPFFYMQNEDIDLCWRAQNMGYKIIACSQSAIFHKGGGSLSWDNPQKVFYTFRNNLVMIARNMPVQRLLWVLPLRMIIDTAAAFQYIIKGKWGAGKAVLTGMFAFWKWLFTASKNKWPDKRGMVACSGFVNRLLVWQYFIRKRKTTTAISESVIS